ncbi:MAG: hypothetical protein FH751_15335 [Firmicutes bacterium]|nr:hypothetical protein [Bacillota bacterium]
MKKKIVILVIMSLFILGACKNTKEFNETNRNYKEDILAEWEIIDVDFDKSEIDEKNVDTNLNKKDYLKRKIIFTNANTELWELWSKKDPELIMLYSSFIPYKCKWIDEDTLSYTATTDYDPSKVVEIKYDVSIKEDILTLKDNYLNTTIVLKKIGEGIQSKDIKTTGNMKKDIKGEWIIINKEKHDHLLINIDEKHKDWLENMELGSYMGSLDKLFSLYNQVEFSNDGFKFTNFYKYKNDTLNKENISTEWIDDDKLYLNFKDLFLKTEFNVSLKGNVLILDNDYGFIIKLLKIK